MDSEKKDPTLTHVAENQANETSEKNVYEKPRIIREESVQSVSLGTGPSPLGC